MKGPCGGSDLVKADVSDEQDLARMVRATIDSLGGLEVLINNAGVQVDAPTDEMRAEDFDRVVAGEPSRVVTSFDARRSLRRRGKARAVRQVPRTAHKP